MAVRCLIALCIPFGGIPKPRFTPYESEEGESCICVARGDTFGLSLLERWWSPKSNAEYPRGEKVGSAKREMGFEGEI